MALDESISENDVVEEEAGLSFVFQKNFAPYMENVVVDYVKTWFGRRLVIESPLTGNC